MNLYEGMFLLDNQVVRADWATAKGAVTGTLEKHGAEILSARRWDERKLTYPIKRRKRATYLLSYFRAPVEGLETLRRDLELDERVLRYLQLRVEALPEGEVEKSRAEAQEGFSFPAPPADEDLAAEQAEEGEAPRGGPEEGSEGGEEAASGEEGPGEERTGRRGRGRTGEED